jgi:hypothetical protein
MMKLQLIYRVFIFVCVSFFFAHSAHTQLNMVQDQPLSFGHFSFSDWYDIVDITVSTDGSFSKNANTVFITNPTYGEYTITGGTPGAAYTISSSSSITLDGDATAGSFTLDNITISPSTGIFDAFGDARVRVGGRLRSAGGGTQYPNDVYTEDLPLIVSY